RTWESIFTHDFYRYQTRLYDRMGDIITLITGPSGTGKELIARAIGLSRFIPFDPSSALFEDDFLVSFFPLNLSALSETLIESELFGHRKGAFTGAQAEKKGYFESCGIHGTVFLDEIGETNTSIQVKLLRVLQTRQFQRLGGTETLKFKGKVITATNRNLEREIKNGNFREDFFFRICSDQLETSGLREIIEENPNELPLLVGFISKRLLGEGSVSEQLTAEVVEWIRQEVPTTYTWPGNFRELEQCVRNIMVHGDYQIKKELVFSGTVKGQPDLPEYLEDFLKGNLSYEALLHHYFKISVNREGGYAQSARAIGIDQRTVKKYYELKLNR
ncbi:MAG: sigma 54-interacting transcriptional regulator, partial [Verrucomicrobiota bacterium]